MKNLLCVALCAAMAVLLLPPAARAQMVPPPPSRMVTVSGEAEAELPPDRAALSVSLVNRHLDLAVAKKENDALVEKLLAVTREFKIPREKVATSYLMITPEYTYDKNQRQFAGYTVSRGLRISMEKLDGYERLLSAVVDAGVDQVGGIEFSLSDREAQLEKIRIRAVENARARAETLARAAGAKLGPVLGISTVGDSRPMAPMPMFKAMRADMAESSAAPELPGMLTLRESVSVSFALE